MKLVSIIIALSLVCLSFGVAGAEIVTNQSLIMAPGDTPSLSENPSAGKETDAPSYATYNGKRLGVLTGPLMEDVAREYFPDSEYLLFNSYPDCITALLAGKIDAYLGDELGVKSVRMERSDIDYIRERITENNYSFAFRKNDPTSAALCEELNAFLARCWSDGTMQELDGIWFGEDEDRKIVDMSDLTGENGIIKVVTTSTDAPFSYIKDGKNVGYDIDLVVRFCRDRGYALELGDVDFAGRIPAIESGKYDFTTDMNVTPEREEQVLFSDAVCKGGIVLAVRTSDLKDSSSENVVGEYLHPQDMAGKRIAVQTGTISGEVAQAVVGDVQLDYYNSQIDAMTALRSNKADAWATDEPVARYLLIENTDLIMIEEKLDNSSLAAVFAKTDAGQALCEQYSAFVDSLWADGTMAEIDAIWFGTDENKRTVLDYEALPATNGTLRMAVDTSLLPFVMVKNNRIVGYDVDIAARFCEANGYRLEVVPMSFDGILPSVQTGKCDFAACCITVTEERAESVLFSSENYKSGTVLVVRRGDVTLATDSVGTYTSLSQLNGSRIGVQTGTNFDAMVSENLPEAQIDYYNTKADLVAALTGHKVEAFAVDEPVAQLLMRENAQITYLPDYLDEYAFAFVFPKSETGEALRDQFNSFLNQLPDGTMDSLAAKWFGEDEDAKTMPDITDLSAENGTLRLATESGYAPFEYVRNGEVVGYDMELAALFCESCGYCLEIVDMNFDGILPAVQTGKCDFAAAGISITPEREESVLFSEPNFSGGTVLAVLKADAASASQTASGKRWQDYNGKRAGVITGSFHDSVITESLPDSSISQYNNYTDMVAALKTDKIDYFLASTEAAGSMMEADDALEALSEPIRVLDIGAMFAKTEKGDVLRTQMDAFINKIRSDGTLDEIYRFWSDPANESTPVDMSGLTGENGTLQFATSGTKVPISFVADGQIAGTDPDIAVRFCREYGYGIEVNIVDTAGIIPGIVTGMYDFSLSDMVITEERKESVSFSVPYHGTELLVMTRAADSIATGNDSTKQEGFIDQLITSFNKTFIREGRWRLFLQGILTTLLITALTILFGTALGFLVFMLCRNGNPAANLITRFCLWLVQGMPMVVLLMILYYVIFGSMSISGVLVAVIGFTLTFGAGVFGLLKMGVGAVDSGQYEAAYALGYSNRKTFYKIILPQALPHVLPAYRGEIVGLIKATAIVGYIAVQDLTKMGDIVRSRTYEAFFPLIAVTVIYFVLEGLIGFLVNRIGLNFNPKRRKPADILKGVKIDDQN